MSQPPRWPMTIVRLFCNAELFDEINGDMDEMYSSWRRMYGEKKARRLYILNTLKFLRPFIFKKSKGQPMTLNYFRIAWRNILRNKGFASINVVGLSLGLTCAIIIYTLVSYHLSFDQYHPAPDQSYRVVMEVTGEQSGAWPFVPQPFGAAFKNDFPFVEEVGRSFGFSPVLVSLPDQPDDKKFEETEVVAFVEPGLFEIFSIPSVSGVVAEIRKPNTAIVTRSIAQKYFGTVDVLNNVIRVNRRGNKHDFRIVAVLEDVADNTQIRKQIYLSYDNIKDYDAWFASEESWCTISGSMECFVKLKPGVTREQVEAALPQLVKKHYNEDDAKNTFYRLQPISEMHFDPKYGGTFSDRNMWTLTIVGSFLLIIACINFVNLATAQVLNRSKEVGVRKVLGSHLSYIFIQFIVETGLIALISLIAAGIISSLILPLVNSMLGERLALHVFDQWQLPVFLVGTLLFVTLAAGVYPAVVMTRFQPVTALKGKMVSGNDRFSMRRALIITQFVVSQVLIICMVVVDSQMDYSQNADLGFDKDAIVMVPIPNRDPTKMKTVKERIAQMPGVHNVSLCYESPASQNNAFTSLVYDNRGKDESWAVSLREGDENYLTTFNIKLIAGHGIINADTIRDLVVNEAFVKKLGLASPTDVIGKRLEFNGQTIKGIIEGVVKDFHTESFHSEISPMVIYAGQYRYRNLAVKVDMDQAQKSITEFNRVWTEAYPENIFSYAFLDDRIVAFYESDNAVLRLVQSFAVIALIISCLGLYGLVSFMAVRKTKEIGVRKVLGASTGSILWLFGKEFAMLIVIAFVVAAPLAWFASDKWLEAFVFRINISPVSFVLAIAGTMIIAAITVSYHSLKSAFANPARSLRTE